MATSPNYSWPEPDNTDLVKNGALAMRTLGNAIDTTMATMTPKSTVTAKGSLIAATAASTPANLAVGNNGETLVADSSTSTGLRYQGSMAAGRNFIVNGGFDIWQRGTSFSQAASTGTTYTADRWCNQTGTNEASTISRVATNDTTNLPFFQYALRFQRNSGQTGTGQLNLISPLESFNSIPLAGKTVTFSFYARAGANYSATSNALVYYVRTGTGTDQNPFSAYTGGALTISSSATLTTTWQRFSATATLPTTTTEIAPQFEFTPTGTAGANDYYEITGVQIEVGSVATQFTRAGGTLQGELAACQRYYYQTSGQFVTSSSQYTSTVCLLGLKLPVTMRTTPSYTAGTGAIFYNGSSQNPTFASNVASVDSYGLQGTTSAVTSGTAEYANLNNDHKFSAEL